MREYSVFPCRIFGISWRSHRRNTIDPVSLALGVWMGILAQI